MSSPIAIDSILDQIGGHNSLLLFLRSDIMTNSASTLWESEATSIELGEDSEMWGSLKEAIAASSGFQRWQLERDVESENTDVSLDWRVSRYLRETLETLAY